MTRGLPAAQKSSEVSEPDRLDEFIVALDALYARREALVTRLHQLTQDRRSNEMSVEAPAEVENIRGECSQIDNRIADLKHTLDSALGLP
jgi:hypothetical protein